MTDDNNDPDSLFDSIDDFEPDDDPDGDFLDFVCGRRPDGSCSLAGTEDCDFECPLS